MISYIFAYGSLLDKKSRETTILTDQVYRCSLYGNYVRFWTYHPRYKDQLVLALSQANTRERINGVLMVVDDFMLSKLDKRESGYIRIELPKSTIDTSYQVSDSIPLYTYVLHRDRELEVENSLANTRYMYICCRGFLQYGADYVKQFIETTDGWKYPWIEYYVDSYKKIS